MDPLILGSRIRICIEVKYESGSEFRSFRGSKWSHARAVDALNGGLYAKKMEPLISESRIWICIVVKRGIRIRIPLMRIRNHASEKYLYI